MFNKFGDELEMFNDRKGMEIHKKIEKQVKEKEKQIHPNDIFNSKKLKGVKKSSNYKRSITDLKVQPKKNTLLL